MAPHLLEEAYEALEAIEAGSAARECEELGDVLMNVLMVAQIASEHGRYGVDDVARAIADKLVRRHPHVFGDAKANDAATVLRNWETIKRAEPDERGARKTVLGGVPRDLPALLRALRIGQKAARVGFDWPDPQGPRAKLDEELAELDEALARGERAETEAELGDVLFSLVNLARHHGLDPELALRATIAKFERRFAHVERTLGDRLEQAPLAEKERLWQEAKGE